MTNVTNINEVLSGHVGLEVNCVDRLLLNAYVPNLQVGGQVVTFLTEHLGFPIPSPALLEKIGNRFRREVKALHLMLSTYTIMCTGWAGYDGPTGLGTPRGLGAF